MTEYSENLSIVKSQNGRRSYFFTAPLVEGYTFGKEPYREFRKGVDITTYQDDSLTTVNSTLTANYAINYVNRELWEAKGNVVVRRADGTTLYTQQLFWDARTKRIYSNVDSKVVQPEGRGDFVGEGFEADEEFKDWRFRRSKGRMEVDVTPTEQPDSTAAEGTPAESQNTPRKPVATPTPSQPQPAPRSRDNSRLDRQADVAPAPLRMDDSRMDIKEAVEQEARPELKTAR